jgi:hypothetical protein
MRNYQGQMLSIFLQTTKKGRTLSIIERGSNLFMLKEDDDDEEEEAEDQARASELSIV